MVEKLQDADMLQRLGGLIGAVWAWWQPDAFFYLVIVLAGSNLADWIFGRHAHRADFSRRASREGVVRKAAQLTILLILRTVEAILPLLVGIPSTRGIVASGLALLLVIEDVESIERHIIALGGRPVPGLSPALCQLKRITGGDRRISTKPREHRHQE